MTELQEQVLIALSKLPGGEGILTRDLAAKMNLSSRKIGAALKSLCDRGCVTRTPKGGYRDWTDRGPYTYRMTRTGLEYLLESKPLDAPQPEFSAIDRLWLYKLHLKLRHDHGLMMASTSRFTYDEHMDDECITLCDALNSIPGLRTFESCCGHGKGPFSIWMTAASILSLYVLARVLDNRYGGPMPSWTLEVRDTDTTDYAVTFYLHSPIVTPTGQYSLAKNVHDADTIALHIHDTLKFMAEMPDQVSSNEACGV